MCLWDPEGKCQIVGGGMPEKDQKEPETFARTASAVTLGVGCDDGERTTLAYLRHAGSFPTSALCLFWGCVVKLQCWYTRHSYFIWGDAASHSFGCSMLELIWRSLVPCSSLIHSLHLVSIVLWPSLRQWDSNIPFPDPTKALCKLDSAGVSPVTS